MNLTDFISFLISFLLRFEKISMHQLKCIISIVHAQPDFLTMHSPGVTFGRIEKIPSATLINWAGSTLT